ncbi:MAG: hypothetical protein AABZ60_17680 [Planctomycetota bacterium]
MSATTYKEVTALDRKFEKKSFEKTNSYENWEVLVTLSEIPTEAWQKSFREQWKTLNTTAGMLKTPEITFKKAVLSVSGLRIETASLFSRVRKALKQLNQREMANQEKTSSESAGSAQTPPPTTLKS